MGEVKSAPTNKMKKEKTVFTKLDEVNLEMAANKLSSKGFILFKEATLHKYKTLMKKKIQSIIDNQPSSLK